MQGWAKQGLPPPFGNAGVMTRTAEIITAVPNIPHPVAGTCSGEGGGKVLRLLRDSLISC